MWRRTLSTPESAEERFGRLYRQHYRAVAGYLAARTDRESAKDALAAVFTIAWRRLGDVPAEPRPWLLGVGRRVLADQRRSTSRQAALVERISQTIEGSVGDQTEAVGARQSLLEALRELRPAQREALLLVTWEGLSQREAAVALGCTTAALKVRVHRARRALQVAMERHELRPPDDGHARPASERIAFSREAR